MARRALSDNAKGKRGGNAGAVLFGLVFAGAGGAMLVFMFILPLLRILGADDWREVPCTVVSSRVTTHSDSDGTTYGVEVEYRYEVDGRAYTSDRRSFEMNSTSSGRSRKEKWVAEHPPGRAMTCYVDPSDPSSAVLDKGFSLSFLWALFPLPFLAIGLFVMWVGVRGLMGKGGEKGSSWRPKSAGVKVNDGAVPTLDAGSEPGPVVFRPGRQRVLGAAGLGVFMLVWNGFIGIFVTMLVREAMGGDVQVCPLLFMVPFVLVGVFLVGVWLRQVMLVFAPVIEVEVDRSVVPVGGAFTLTWRVPGRRGRLTSMAIDLVGEERATYRRGTDTITDTHVFYEDRLAGTGSDEQPFDTLPAVPDRGSVVVKVPADSMHTFKAGNNKIAWKLKVGGSVPRWPDPEDTYEITVLPMKLG